MAINVHDTMKSVNIFFNLLCNSHIFPPPKSKTKNAGYFWVFGWPPEFFGLQFIFPLPFFPPLFLASAWPEIFFQGISNFFFCILQLKKIVNEKGKCPKKSRDEPCMYPVLEIQEKKDERNPYFLLKESVIYKFTLNPRNTLSFLLIHLS